MVVPLNTNHNCMYLKDCLFHDGPLGSGVRQEGTARRLPSSMVMGMRLIMISLLPAATLATNEAGKKWLAEKATQAGVLSLDSGLLYKVLVSGDGDSHPTVDSTCSCHYAGTLIDGTQFDSSYGPRAHGPTHAHAGRGQRLLQWQRQRQWLGSAVSWQ